MRFGRALREAQVPEWRSFYCDYDRLQQLVLRCAASQEAEMAAKHAEQQDERLLTQAEQRPSPPPLERPMSTLQANM